MVTPTKILVPTDFSDYSNKAFERAIDIAKQNGAELVLFHVVDQDIQACRIDYCLEENEMETLEEEMMKGARDRLAKEAEKFSIPRELKVSTEVRHGVPYEEILKFQELHGVDLIVIGSHGRSAIVKYFLGSVSSNVLRGAKCEVLLVK